MVITEQITLMASTLRFILFQPHHKDETLPGNSTLVSILDALRIEVM
jgi:hypothetical protein